MQIQAENSSFFANLINQAKNILILTGKNLEVDTLAAALFLENILRALGKNVQVVAKGDLPENFDPSPVKIKDRVDLRKLVVSFNWHKNGIEKVSYDLEGENFNFIISPRNKAISEDEIKISFRGYETDLIITLGLASLTELEQDERESLEKKEIINIDKSTDNQLYGKLNFVNEFADSICAQVAKLVEKSQLSPPVAAIDYLLAGMRAATDDFNSVADPTTFEAAAFCARIKKGVLRKQERQGYLADPHAPKEWLSPKIFRSDRQAS